MNTLKKTAKQLVCVLFFTTFLLSYFAEARVGGGRSFGSRGSRGFTSPRSSSFSNPSSNSSGNPYRSGTSPYGNSYSPQNQPPLGTTPQPAIPSRRSSFLSSLGAGIAGGMLGGMLARSFGWAGQGYGGGMGGGIGIFEIFLIGGLLFLLYRLFSSQNQPSASSGNGAEDLMRKARPFGWNPPSQQRERNLDSDQRIDPNILDITPINPELAMDLFFRIQGAWTNRDLSSVQGFLDREVTDYLGNELARLKSARQINRLENIAVRSTDVVEAWRESDREFSTVKILASLLDYTVDENTNQVLEGSKSDPVKFEEYWTFSRAIGTSQWKLSAIQQS